MKSPSLNKKNILIIEQTNRQLTKNRSILILKDLIINSNNREKYNKNKIVGSICDVCLDTFFLERKKNQSSKVCRLMTSVLCLGLIGCTDFLSVYIFSSSRSSCSWFI